MMHDTAQTLELFEKESKIFSFQEQLTVGIGHLENQFN